MTPSESSAAGRATLIARMVAFVVGHAGAVAAAGVALGIAAAFYAASHFAMSTATDQLINPKLPWRQSQIQYDAAFPHQANRIVAVIDGATPELAEQSAAALAAALETRPDLFPVVQRPQGALFWQRNGLLYAPLKDVESATAGMITAQPLLGSLAADPSLRGLMTSLSTAMTAVSAGQTSLADLDPTMSQLADALQGRQDGRAVYFSWRNLLTGAAPAARDLRQIVLITPKLDYSGVKPGEKATKTIRDAARALGLDSAHGVRVRLTGSVPLEDDELGTLTEGLGLIGFLATSAILLMLWFAVGSPRIIACIIFTTLVGLACAAAFGLLAFHTFNVISVAFIPLFVGLGIDFGIQYSVRFRTEYKDGRQIGAALIASAQGMGRPLALAALAIASGFLAFAPTDYIGVSQLGIVAGFGMLLALGLNLTLLPALIAITRPPGAKVSAARHWFEAVDAFVLGRRRTVVGTALVVAVICAALVPLLHFDFNPIHMRDRHAESVATLYDLMRDPEQSPNTMEMLRPTTRDADALASRLARAPEVYQARTLDSFIPADQDAKLALIADAATLLDLTLTPQTVLPAPTDAETVASIRQTGADLRAAAGAGAEKPAQDARRLAVQLERLAGADPAMRARIAEMLLPGLRLTLAQLREMLQAEPVTVDKLPADLVADWRTSDGRIRVSALPRGDSNDNRVLEPFIAAVTKIAPDATGGPVGLFLTGQTIVNAFLEAGILSFVAITIILLIALRRVRDVAITMAPIVLTGLLTLGSCVVLSLPLNFANIIALPLLFGIGVAFHIYFVMAWRSGEAHLLQSSLARGIFFSALTTATGFGSLWASHHPGTASMGKLLMISLAWTLISALLFQPALMGPPAPTSARGPHAHDPAL